MPSLEASPEPPADAAFDAVHSRVTSLVRWGSTQTTGFLTSDETDALLLSIDCSTAASASASRADGIKRPRMGPQGTGSETVSLERPLRDVRAPSVFHQTGPRGLRHNSAGKLYASTFNR